MSTGTTDGAAKATTGLAFHHPLAFWSGATAIVLGVLLHLPDFVASADMGYRLAGMEGMDDMGMSNAMVIGMALIIAGIAAAAYGLLPRSASLGEHQAEEAKLSQVRFKAMDDAELSPAHWGMLTVLGVALVIDVMKPATIGFVLPGMREEYGISTAQVALFPFAALTGTTIGSLLWGALADRVGRRASILLSSLIFIATSICGFMPHFEWNVAMCFFMGLSAGGMLPIVYALMAESVPANKRGWLVVLHGGMGTVGGYLAASGFATLLEPTFGWRILWFLGLPTGALMLVLNRWIPESPRFLLSRGRVTEARAVMARFGVRVEEPERVEGEAVEAADQVERIRIGFRPLFRQPYRPQTTTIMLYGLGWGLVNWGFLTFLPTILRELGYEDRSYTSLLFLSALIAVPGTFVVAWLYGKWSSKKSMVVYALATVLTLFGFSLANPGPGGSSVLLTCLVVALLVSSGGVISMLSPYTAEVYPTHLRGTGSGLAAGSSKIGGMMAPPLFAGLLAVSTGLAVPALAVAVPMLASAVVVGFRGVETKGRRLEDISREEVPSGV